MHQVSFTIHTGLLPYARAAEHGSHNDVHFPPPSVAAASGGDGQGAASRIVCVSEDSLPVASTAHPQLCNTQQLPDDSVHRKETVALEEGPPSLRSPSPLERPTSSLSSGSCEENTELLSGTKPPSRQHIQRMLEDLFASDSSDSGELEKRPLHAASKSMHAALAKLEKLYSL